jgi:4-hydroxyproline epimerase
MVKIHVVDSHTGGEPTRVVLDGIELQGATMMERREDFRSRLDHMRTGVVLEPRGSDVLVGAVLTPPVSESAVAGVVFFNNAGYLGMCGHGTIGVVETLRHLGRISPGSLSLDTPVGTVQAVLSDDGEVTIANVRSYRYRADVRVELPGGSGEVVGDVAYGGNWFYVVHEPTFDVGLDRVKELTDVCETIKAALVQDGVQGENGAEIDHIEIADASGRNFVLCPGGAYDRSPCGTGTSAKMACLFAAGELEAGQEHVQESVTGSVFRGSVQPVEGGVMPTIVGRAHITAESTLIFNDDDPIRWGLIP